MSNDIQIVPAILSNDFEDIRGKMSLVKKEVALVQIDICDGFFGETRTWPFFSMNDLDLIKEEGFPFWKEVNVEIDFLLENPLPMLEKFLDIGVESIVLHIESKGFVNAFNRAIDILGNKGKRFTNIVLSISPSSDILKLNDFLPEADSIQLMGNDVLGAQGKKLDDKIFAKIVKLRELYPDTPLAIDIGVNLDTAKKLAQSGITKLVAGSAVFSSEGVVDGISKLKSSLQNA